MYKFSSCTNSSKNSKIYCYLYNYQKEKMPNVCSSGYMKVFISYIYFTMFQNCHGVFMYTSFIFLIFIF